MGWGFFDFTKFFEPRYNINAIGKDVFYRSLDGDIEAYSDLDIAIIGKDTIDDTNKNLVTPTQKKNKENVKDEN